MRLAVTALLSLGSLLAYTAGAAERTNFLFIIADDASRGSFGAYGSPDVETPNFDRLAGRGQLFTNSYCAAPLCNPSRTALFTGMSPARTGIINNARNARQDHVTPCD